MRHGMFARKAGLLAGLLAIGLAVWLILGAAPAHTGEQPIYIVLEPEKAEKIEAPMVKGTESEEVCSAGGYIEIPLQQPRGTDKVNGKAIIPFEIKTPGKYFLHARCWWYDGCGNSFGITIDKGDKATLTGSTEKRWRWEKLGDDPILLLAGKHVLVISNSEDGARLDQVLITNDLSYIPQGIE